MNSKNEMLMLMEPLVELTNIQKDKFWQFYKLLDRYNDEYDLSRLKSFEDIVIKHFIDSIYFLKYIELPDSIVDIGTGAGFPGIPLKIMVPELKLILAEPRPKRVKFMEMVIKELEFDNVEIYPHKVSDKSFFKTSGIITRAFASIDDTLSIVNHFLPENGKVIFMKGPDSDNDKSVLNEFNKKSFKLEKEHPYKIPNTPFKRNILIYNKNTDKVKKIYRIFINTDETIGMPISSKENKTFKNLKKSASSEGIKKTGKLIVSGKKIIRDYIEKYSAEKNEIIIYDGYTEDNPFFIKLFEEYHHKGSIYILKKSLYNEIDTLKTQGPLLIKNMLPFPNWDGVPVKGCTLMIPFQDPINVGSIIRSAAGFNVSRIVMLKGSANPFHSKSIRSSSGSVFNVDIFQGPLLKDIDYRDNNIVTMSMEGENIKDFNFPDSFILLPGEEGRGLPDELRKNSVSIPLSDRIESLNAPVAVSILLYEWKNR